MSRVLPVGLRRAVFGVLLISLVAPLEAQTPRRSVSVGLGGGGTVPIGDFADDVKTGWNAGTPAVKSTYQMIPVSLGFRF